MDLLSLLRELLFDYTLRTVALSAATLGIVSGALGSYAVLRRQSLLGDAISHAALPGIALAFLLTGSKEPLVLMIGAAIAGWLGTLLMMSIVCTTRIKDDSAPGLILSVFFGFGLMLLTFIQRQPDAGQAGLDKFLFGQAAALLQRDVITMAVLGGLALLMMAIFRKEFKLLSFDPDYGASLGYPMRMLDILLTTLARHRNRDQATDCRRRPDERHDRRACCRRAPMDRPSGPDGRAFGAVWSRRRRQRRRHQQQRPAIADRPDNCLVDQRHCARVAPIRAQSRPHLELGAQPAQLAQPSP
jgi:ABC-type Mn2+/Zn2+ transport system permease subunit